jgi:gamma-glutamylcyclotransferase (GGCT)/AIG2-like uncharacterized protein YtfP
MRGVFAKAKIRHHHQLGRRVFDGANGLRDDPVGRISPMAERVFFYGTLRTGFSRRPQAGVNSKLRYVGHGWINAALFDLGIYPAAVPAPQDLVWGEVFEMDDPETVLSVLDEIEGYRQTDPDQSLYRRVQVPVMLDGDRSTMAWVYFYNAPLGRAERIPSGDYLEHLRVK